MEECCHWLKKLDFYLMIRGEYFISFLPSLEANGGISRSRLPRTGPLRFTSFHDGSFKEPAERHERRRAVSLIGNEWLQLDVGKLPENFHHPVKVHVRHCRTVA
ncbi:hypothetical protein TNIN_393651 [Trichonephila inaurata madagascariensis]|uniref:Uncharacterized protein n=1 Tax=Trichonephila inaurata madagascariensis TaxID=2747483 RepID=A0A8X7CFY4_9ARAC|nr:hypothetical protein TNIN_393651 [Trichonephila inaurata madagascariensis]